MQVVNTYNTLKKQTLDNAWVNDYILCKATCIENDAEI